MATSTTNFTYWLHLQAMFTGYTHRFHLYFTYNYKPYLHATSAEYTYWLQLQATSTDCTKSITWLNENKCFFLRPGGLNAPNRIIEEVVASSVCGALNHCIPPSSRRLLTTPELRWYYFGVKFFLVL